MSYAVMTLRLRPENNESKIGAFVQRINSNRVPDTDWQGKGFYEAKGAWNVKSQVKIPLFAE